MSDRKSQKQLTTEIVLAQMPANLAMEQFAPIDQVISKWWMTNRQAGMRLTDAGDLAFRTASIEFFSCPMGTITDGSYYSFVAEVSKKIKCPYYLGVTKVPGTKNDPFIRVYDSKVALLIGLYGNIREYLDSIPVASLGKQHK